MRLTSRSIMLQRCHHAYDGVYVPTCYNISRSGSVFVIMSCQTRSGQVKLCHGHGHGMARHVTPRRAVSRYTICIKLWYAIIYYHRLCYIYIYREREIHTHTLHYITLHYNTLHYITLHYITLHYITLHYITLHYITLYYITLHYITLHYITLHYIHMYVCRYVCMYVCVYIYIYIHTIKLVCLK